MNDKRKDPRVEGRGGLNSTRRPPTNEHKQDNRTPSGKQAPAPFVELAGCERADAIGLVHALTRGARGRGVTAFVDFRDAPAGCCIVAIALDKIRLLEIAISGWEPYARMSARNLWQAVNEINTSDWSAEETARALANERAARRLLKDAEERKDHADDLITEFHERWRLCETLLDCLVDPATLLGAIPPAAVIWARARAVRS